MTRWVGELIGKRYSTSGQPVLVLQKFGNYFSNYFVSVCDLIMMKLAMKELGFEMKTLARSDVRFELLIRNED